MRRRSGFKKLFPAAILMTFVVTAPWYPAFAEAWKFGVMSDTQWTVPNDGKNPHGVAVGLIEQINAQFIEAGVKFVVQVGDLTEKGTRKAMLTRATAAEPLYNAGIGFYPLRGNHEKQWSAAVDFYNDFPQTRGLGPYVFGATSFSSPQANLDGLSYSFDYEDSRFVLLDQYTRLDGTGNTKRDRDNTNIADQQRWVNKVLAGRPSGGHVFVFAHENLIGDTYPDVLLGSDPGKNPKAQNAFIGSLASNGIRYFISGHDHIHQRSLVKSPDGQSQVQQIISGSDSSKFFFDNIPAYDTIYDHPRREVSITQETNTVGYYIYTVDGLRVTVDYYSAKVHPKLVGKEYLIYKTPNLKFTWRETFGYSLNGREFRVKQGASYTVVNDVYSGTKVRILSGTNESREKDGSGRPLTKVVNTAWEGRTSSTLSNVVTFWGLAATLGSAKTDEYVLSMTGGMTGISEVSEDAATSESVPILVTRNAGNQWVNAVDLNSGGHKRFVSGPWAAGYPLGTYGFDMKTGIAWAVIDHAGDFAVARYNK